MNLFESGAPKVLFHYTNLKAIMKIIDQNRIRTKSYEIGSHDLSTDKEWYQRAELATIRPSMVKTIDIKQVTSAAAGVRIIIQTDKLLDKIRGVKVRPIAEFPLGSIKSMEELMKRAGLSDSEARVATRKVLSGASKFIGKNFNPLDNYPLLTKFINKVIGETTNKKVKAFNDGKAINYFMVEKIKKYLQWSDKREGEERIVSNKAIPLDSRYLKIEFLPRISFKNANITLKAGFVILNNRDLFVNNAAFKRLVKFIKKLIADHEESVKMKYKTKKST